MVVAVDVADEHTGGAEAAPARLPVPGHHEPIA
jgi:hypothetical protein